MTNELSNDELKELVHKLSWNDGFGCYTRAGFEQLVWPMIRDRARWILYFDLDNIHALNESFGSYEPVDRMVKQVLSTVRSTDYVAGQYKSGDEFLVCITESDARGTLNPEGMQERLIVELAKHGISATFAIVPVTSLDLATNVKPAVDMVYAVKKQRGGAR
jgi:FOG: GGDEF domain